MNREQQFAEKTGLSEKSAKRILSLIYKKGLDAKSLDRVIYRLQDMIIKFQITKLIDAQKDADINTVIDEMILQDNRHNDRAVEEGFGERLRFFTELGSLFSTGKTDGNQKQLKEGDKVTIQIMRVGNRRHPMYGQVKVTEDTLKEVEKNFKEDVRGIDIAVDENHENNHKALGRYRDIFRKGKEALFSVIELTKKGAELLNEGSYKYFSPEIVFRKIDEETGKLVKNLLIGGAFTNRPFFKAMQPLLASEEQSATNPHQTKATSQDNEKDSLFFYTSNEMNTFLQLLAQFSEQETISKSEKAQIEAAFNELPAEDKKVSKEALDTLVGKFSEEGDDASDEGADKAGDSADDAGDDADKEKKTGDDKSDEDDSEDEEDQDDDSDDEDDADKAKDGDTVAVKASEWDETQKEVKQLRREKREAVLEGKFNELQFNETTKKGVFLPKNKSKIVKFALSLTEKRADKFFEIMEELKVDQSLFTEAGSSTAEATEQQFTEEAVAVYMKDNQVERPEAIKALKEAGFSNK